MRKTFANTLSDVVYTRVKWWSALENRLVWQCDEILCSFYFHIYIWHALACFSNHFSFSLHLIFFFLCFNFKWLCFMILCSFLLNNIHATQWFLSKTHNFTFNACKKSIFMTIFAFAVWVSCLCNKIEITMSVWFVYMRYYLLNNIQAMAKSSLCLVQRTFASTKITAIHWILFRIGTKSIQWSSSLYDSYSQWLYYECIRTTMR